MNGKTTTTKHGLIVNCIFCVNQNPATVRQDVQLFPYFFHRFAPFSQSLSWAEGSHQCAYGTSIALLCIFQPWLNVRLSTQLNRESVARAWVIVIDFMSVYSAPCLYTSISAIPTDPLDPDVNILAQTWPYAEKFSTIFIVYLVKTIRNLKYKFSLSQVNFFLANRN